MKIKKQIKPLRLLILLFLFPLCGFAQTISVKGVVKDAKGETLVGVSVKVAGTTNGTITNVSGAYEVKAPEKSKLSFSYIGYKSTVIEVNGKNTINVVLEEDSKALEEVVVVGYGNQRKEAVTGSVASVKGDVMREVPAGNITQALQGRLSGVQMSQNSTKPGATMQIRIRGTRSITAENNPLVVLDGIPFAGSLADISTDDIKSIDILKDASATAIYGSRGANGVILITTNKGSKGQKAELTYNGYYGQKNPVKFPMMNATEFHALRTAAKLYTANSNDETDDANTDWQDLFYRTGIVTNHDLAVSGGNEKGSYKFGVNYYNDQSPIPLQDYSRYAFRGSLDQEIGKYFHFGFTTNNNYHISNGNDLGTYGVLSMSPMANPWNTDNTWKRTIKMQLDEQWSYSKDVLNNLGDSYINQNKGFGSYNTMFGELKVPGIEGLKLRVNAGANLVMGNNGSYTGSGVFQASKTSVSNATISNSLQTNWAIENLVTYDREFAQKHRLNVVGLYSAEQTQYNKSTIAAKNIASDVFQYYNLGQAVTTPDITNPYTVDPGKDYQDYWVSGLMSYMGRVMYSYDDRYMISATVRSDASSRLAPGHQSHTYPAVSIGWNIMKESFMKDVSVIDALKLRAGYGQTSNQSVAPYQTLGQLATRPYNFGTSYSTGLYVSKLPSPDLGWEYSETGNIGLDFSLLKNRLTGTVEYYVTNTKDVLLSLTLPATSGSNSVTKNVGTTQNKGAELTLNGVILDNLNGWTWEAGVNISTNQNKLTSLASGQTKDEANSLFVGHSLNVVYDYKKVGLWQKSDSVQQGLYEPGTNSTAGMIRVEYTGTLDSVGNPTRPIGAADRQIYDMDPLFVGGFNTRVAYKGFDLSIVGGFQGGGTLISTIYGPTGYLNMMTGRRGNVKIDYWTPDNTEAKYPNPAGNRSGDFVKYASLMSYFDASYVKIRTITLGYSLNPKWLKNTAINKLHVYVTAQNPIVLFSPYYSETGMDPETNSMGNENQASVGTSISSRILVIGTNTPTTRNWLVGLNMSF